MQKKIIALAIAGLASTAAFAQTNVTIYGIVDASAYGTSVSTAPAGLNKTNYGFLSNAVASSRLGFKGTEDLGNGLKAIFNLETELSLATGQMGSSTAGAGAGTFSRAANVGLASNYGTLTLGRQATPTYAAVAASDVLGANSGGLINAWVYSNLDTTASRITGLNNSASLTNMTNNAAALPNAYAAGAGYASPVFAGLQVKVYTNVGNNTTGYDYSNAGLRDIGVSYNNGGIALNVTHQAVRSTSATNADINEQKNTLVGGSYTFGDVKLAAAWVKTKFDASLANADDIRTYTLGGTYQLGKTKLGLSYTNTKDTEVTANKTTQITAMADYALSKRTSAYALVTRANNSGAAQMNGLYTANATTAGAVDATSIALGVRHSF